MQDQLLKSINRIFDFYENLELSNGFDSDVLKEENSEEMTLPRLKRAVINAAAGNLLHSRYAIWASNVNDLIKNATAAINSGDPEAALKQMKLAANAMKAYRDIQILFDTEKNYKGSELFRSYASYLLSIDDSQSGIVNKGEIVKRLKNNSTVSGASLPRDIEFHIKNKVLSVFIHDAVQNMQVDSAAFEGWILVLKTWLSGEIEYVVLDFKVPENLSGQYGNSEVCHYNRFLYRLNNMLRLFPNWFFLTEGKRSLVSDFLNWMDASTCLLNHSLRERKSVIGTEKMERQIESWFVFEEGKELLGNRWDIDKEKIFNQLPIGVFYEKISSKNPIFTRGASAIDIWGVGNDRETLHLIELKCGDNKGIGVISEMLFYAAVVYDAHIASNKLFSYGKYGKAPDTRDIAAMKNNGDPFNKIAVHLLAEKYHPLFNSSVEGMICSGLSNLGIHFDRATYDYSKKGFIDENNDL